MRERQLPSTRARGALVAALVLGALAAAAIGVPNRLYGPVAIAGALAAVLSLASRRGARLATRATLLLATVAWILAGVDLGLRAFLVERFFPLPADRFARREAADPRLARFARGVEFTGRTWGDLAAMYGDPQFRQGRDGTFRTDELGFRNPPGSSEQPIEVLVLGDSFGAAIGVGESASWLERLRGGVRNVYSLSVPGGPWHEAIRLKRVAPQLEFATDAVLVWLLFSGNDLDDECGESFAVPPPAGFARRLTSELSGLRDRSPLRRLLRAWRGKKRELVVLDPLSRARIRLYFAPYLERAQRSRAEVEGHPGFDCLRRAVAEVSDTSRRLGLRLVVVALPSKEEIHGAAGTTTHSLNVPFGFQEAVGALLSDRGIGHHDATSALLEAHRAVEGKDWGGRHKAIWWDDGTHWSEHGNEIFARWLEERLPAPAARRPRSP